jgi:hypothetical protein
MPEADRKTPPRSAELQRLEDAGEWDAPWRRWGPYLSERQWGTVREDYSHRKGMIALQGSVNRARGQ